MFLFKPLVLFWFVYPSSSTYNIKQPTNDYIFQVQAALDAALQDEDDIQLDASSEQFTKKAKPR